MSKPALLVETDGKIVNSGVEGVGTVFQIQKKKGRRMPLRQAVLWLVNEPPPFVTQPGEHLKFVSLRVEL